MTQQQILAEVLMTNDHIVDLVKSLYNEIIQRDKQIELKDTMIEHLKNNANTDS